MGTTLLTRNNTEDEVDVVTHMDTEYLREEKRNLEEEKDGWALLFSANSGGSAEDIERESREETDRFAKKHGIDRVRASRFRRLERERGNDGR